MNLLEMSQFWACSQTPFMFWAGLIIGALIGQIVARVLIGFLKGQS